MFPGTHLLVMSMPHAHFSRPQAQAHQGMIYPKPRVDATAYANADNGIIMGPDVGQGNSKVDRALPPSLTLQPR